MKTHSKESNMPTDLVQVFSLCTVALTLLLLGLAFHTATIRGFIEKSYFNPEDVKMGKGKAEQEDGPKTQRWGRAHRNLMENYIPFVVIGSLLVAKVPESAFWSGALIVFTLFRFSHATAYINKLQPFRTLSFLGGWIVTVMMSVKLLLVWI